jgi:hypothetical protein
VKTSAHGGIQKVVLRRILPFLSLLGLLLISIPNSALADPSVSSGEFIDSQGVHHLWHVNSQHALLWGGRPWLPAGGVFQSKYLTGPATAENWASDQADLAKLKQHGIHSLVLVMSAELDPITGIPTEKLQKVLDYLDAQGFQYGISLCSFPRDPVEATIVNPALYRVAAPAAGAVNYFSSLSGLISARYYLVSQADGSILSSGSAAVVDAQTASVTLGKGLGGPGTVLLLFPTRIFLPDSIEGAHLPDIWTQADAYRDNLLLYFGKIKFGSGLRFFLDPVVSGLGYYGDADAGAIPDGPEYRFQFEAWLESKYGKSLAMLNNAWNVKNQDIFDFAAAARIIPLWYQSRGVQLFVDPASNKTFEANGLTSEYWDDVRQFRSDSMRSVMDELAIAIKNGIADVPVVYRWTRPSKMYVDTDKGAGYDGLLVSSLEHGSSLVSNAAGQALSETEQSSRSTWLLGELSPPSLTAASGYMSQPIFNSDIKALRSVAVKGYFIDSFRRLDDATTGRVSLLDSPSEQLDWIHADDAGADLQADRIASFVPSILFYPLNIKLPETSIKQFDDGTWWLPSYRTGKVIDVGPGVSCYSMTQPTNGTALVLWSPSGSVSEASFQLPKGTPIVANTLNNVIVTISLKKGVYTIPISKTPLLLRGVTTLPLIANATALAMAESVTLIGEGTNQHIPMDVNSQRLYYIKNEILGNNDVAHQQTAYPLLVALNNDLKRELDTNAWVEGESASQQTFGTVVASSSASGGAFLWQDTDHAPVSSSSPYEASYTLNVGAPGNYTVWASIAPGAPGTGATSPISYSLDDGTKYDVSQPDSAGDAYGSVLDAAAATHVGNFRWYRIGSLSLNPGIHQLNFYITGEAPVTKRYTLGIDAICLARGSFVPNGAQRPSVE